MTIIDQKPRSTRAIRQDRWDLEDWVDTAGKVDKLTALATELADKVGLAGADIVSDAWQAFHKHAPRVEDRSVMEPSHARNVPVAEALMAEDKLHEARSFTVGDPLASAMATITFGERIAEMYEKLPVDDEVARAEDAQRTVDQLLSDLNADPAQVEAARGELADAEEALAGAIAQHEPAIGRAVRAALREACDEAEDAAQVAAGWGLAPGEAARMDPAVRLALAERISTPRMRAIVDLFGRMRSLWWGEVSRKLNHDPEELHDIVTGDHLAHVLPIEFLGLVVEELEIDFLYRFATARLLEYELRGNEKEGKGGVFYIEDSSGSMGGDKEIWSKAAGLSFLGIAKDQGRSFNALCFGGTGQFVEFRFERPADFVTERMVDYAEFFMKAGGTEPQGPLTAALTQLEAEYAATGRTQADIVLATDGAFNVADDWLAHFKERQQTLGFRVFGIAIGCDPTAEPFASICDGRVSSIVDLASGDNIADLFHALT